MELIRLLLRVLVDDCLIIKSKPQYHEIDNNNKTKEEVCQEYNDFSINVNIHIFMIFFIFKQLLLILAFVDIILIHAKIY